MQGFIVNDATLSVATGSFGSVKLHEDSAIDARSKAMPNACYLSHLDLKFTGASSTTSVEVYITYDSTGDDPCTNTASTVTLTAGATSGVKHTTINIGQYITAPASQSNTGALQLFLKSAGGGCTLAVARVHWHDKA